MATSGTTVFDLQIDDIIEEAYERCGLRTNSGNDIRSARRSLNLLFSEWGNRGVHLWKVNLNQIIFTAGVATYSVPTQVNDVLEAYISSSGAINGTLNTALTNVATSVVLTDATGFASSGTVQIGLEFITYTGKSTNTLTGATRGALGSLAVAHAAGVPVQNITGQGTSSTQDVSLTKIDRSAYSALPNKLATKKRPVLINLTLSRYIPKIYASKYILMNMGKISPKEVFENDEIILLNLLFQKYKGLTLRILLKLISVFEK